MEMIENYKVNQRIGQKGLFVMSDMSDKIIDKNKNSTFVLKVQFQQNSTWQGAITWVEENRTQNFRSELEMLKLMMEAMCIEDEITFNTWEG